MKCVGSSCPDDVHDVHVQLWDTALRGHLSGIAQSRPRKYHQTTPSAIPATKDLKPRIWGLAFQLLKEKESSVLEKENSLSSLVVYKDL